ncbi:inositol monophosphatase family protein [Streptomyces sp. NPDC056149]|uniref:inositol monophosphatase family protein n=1 Tax=Streptomyces sp. NPDC056149 TaxID=3345728 RepID=UPI0035E10138
MADGEMLARAAELTARTGRRAAATFGVGAPRGADDGAGPENGPPEAVEAAGLLRAELAAAFPDVAVCGGTVGARPDPAGPRWMIAPPPRTDDPARPLCLAYEDASGPSLGVVQLPLGGRTVAAGRGLGCRLLADGGTEPADCRPVRTGGRAELTGARALTDGPAGWPEPLLTAVHRRVALTASGGGALDVVTGRADAWLSIGPVTYGERAALTVVVAEAGGRITDLSGAPVLTGDGSVLVTNGPLHEGFLRLIAEAGGHEPKPVVDAPDPGWAAEGAALTEGLRALLGPLALRAEHIGSTSVPGMAAKPVFDLQVSVADLAEAAVAFDGPLAGAGFEPAPHLRDHVPAGRADAPERWAKRFWSRRGGPGPDVNLHVRRAGSPNERLALLFRDWFRAHPEAVPAYARFKRELAHRVPELGAYADVKDPVVDLVIEVAEPWAAATGWRP